MSIVIALVTLVLLLVHRLRHNARESQRGATTSVTATLGDQQSKSKEEVCDYKVINGPGESESNAFYDYIDDGGREKDVELQQNVTYATSLH